ncbi:hypothetical protein DTO013E5_1377 [Penicillium roqueforti]|uniref:Genomic scaffold, ProqFM164S03 n=1 Tax=Penicillium roqueforti (strain FM164) TaxID=1365484 RepID=W6QA93_PENRF|nr:uncharacterized protein LCP9604111_5068 [Penicillium roqueforti]CDM33588.1 unnamed protein product [Penicillium roqueforti FM164]KAF9248829.1 hypothetical protein LCP9604111_5068 [Penicillium roqueforti]KAI1831705.1 hypothetical protein CBS147337_7515 [Penicillium roqueforti]KAI2681616.1 hypothetical protein CBS147355_2826 [Penicillium roqueforti]KAI2689004.1 hypothetical protein LCP963914a_2093 [Penicillium roqueforti]
MDANHPPSTDSQHNSIVLRIVHWDKLFESDSPPRLGIEFGKRLPYATLSAFSTGLALGYYHGSKRAGLVFRAENAHRFPTTSTGWFQYHKTKNYIGVVGGVKDGMKMGFKLGAGALAFCLFEETVDYARHDERDFLSTVTAGLSFSGIYSLLARHDVYTAARTAKLGLKLSLTYGLLQDALGTLKGNRPAYVDFLLGNRRSKVDKEASM